jgi:hypothetical protein
LVVAGAFVGAVIMFVAGVLVSIIGAGVLVDMSFVIGAALVAAILVSAGGVVEEVISLSALLLQPARATGRARVRSASREYLWRRLFICSSLLSQSAGTIKP